jgi:meiotic recombination protein SPO11
MYALVDFDPDGVKIMLTYKIGSQNLQHEEHVTLDRLCWIGLKSDDVLSRNHRGSPPVDMSQEAVYPLTADQQFPSSQPSSSSCDRNSSLVKGTLPLKARDRKLAVRLLAAAAENDEQPAQDVDLIRELQLMLLINAKAEIQMVDEAGDLSEWLDDALTKQLNNI